jgi:hypothetical protein
MCSEYGVTYLSGRTQQLTATADTVSDERAVFLPSTTQEIGAILQVLPPKNPVKNRTVDEPDQ